MNKTLRVGIIGAGFHAVLNHIPPLQATGRAEVVAIARRNPDRLALLQRELGIPEGYTSWQAMLNQSQLDAVIVSTPINLLQPAAMDALAKGLHVLQEKPIADSIQGAQALVDAAHKSGKVVTVGTNLRGGVGCRAIKHAVDAGKIGILRQISITCCMDMRMLRNPFRISESVTAWLNSTEINHTLGHDWIDNANWRFDPEKMGGDMLFDAGSHLVDFLMWVARAPAVEVVAFKAGGDARSAAIMSFQARLANDVLLSIHFNDNVSGGDFNIYGQGQFTAYGDEGFITANYRGFAGGDLSDVKLERHGQVEAVELQGEWMAPATAFVSSVLDGAPNYCTVEDGAHVVALIQSAYRSAVEGRIVPLKELK